MLLPKTPKPQIEFNEMKLIVNWKNYKLWSNFNFSIVVLVWFSKIVLMESNNIQS